MSGADGENTPSAPESSDRQAPQEPEEVLGHAGEGRAEQRRPRLLPVWILLGAAVASGGAWAVTERLGGGAPPAEEAQARLIAASAEPWKVRPDDPGGMEIPNQGTLIYETLSTADPEEGPERILPPPEQPLSLPQPVADGAEEPAAPAAPASDAAGDESDPGPDLAPFEVASAPPTASAPPSGAPEPAADEDSFPPESEVPDAALVEETPSREGGAPVPRPVAKPRPDTPEAAPSAVIEEAPLPEPDAPAPVADAETPSPEPEAPVLAVATDTSLRDAEAPAAPSQADDAVPVPIPADRPVRHARAAQEAIQQVAPSGEAAAAARPEPDAEQSTSRNWRYVQLAAAGTRGPLEDHWEMLRQRHDDVLLGLSPLIMPVDSGDSGITYRLRAGPLSDRERARRVCERLKARGLDCFVPRD